MSGLTVAINDEHLFERLSKLARENNLTVDEQATLLLKEMLQTARYETFYEAAVRIAAMTPKDQPQQPSSLELLREDRDR